MKEKQSKAHLVFLFITCFKVIVSDSGRVSAFTSTDAYLDQIMENILQRPELVPWYPLIFLTLTKIIGA